jgi:hypothetical protein
MMMPSFILMGEIQNSLGMGKKARAVITRD